jgi:hypothetical protein
MSDQITRRDFSVQSALALLSGVTITISSCGGGSSSGGPTGPSNPGNPGSPNNVQGAVSDNHGHSVTISAAQLTAANDLVLTLVGGDHPHTVALSGGEVAQIAARARVSKLSSGEAGHSHTVTFN